MTYRRWIACFVLALGLFACVGCGSRGSADGGGTGTSAHGLAKIGIPF
jgi:hypothetical protein